MEGILSLAGGSSPTASPTPTGSNKPVITGGTLYSDSTYYYRAFTSDDTLVVSGATLNADVLVIGAGGGTQGATQRTGGGGAGGLLFTNGLDLNADTYNIVVGLGGSGNGDDSQLTNT